MSDSPTPQQASGGKETGEQALLRAFHANKAGRVHEAAGICQDLLVAAPDLPGALAMLGCIQCQQGKFEEAIAMLERAVSGQLNVSNWHLNLAGLYRGINRLDRSMSAGQEAMRLAPDAADPRVELALTHLSLGELDAAARRFREAIARDPESARGHMGLGELLLAQGEYVPGWMEYAWRNKLPQARGTLPPMKAAPWNGMHLPNGTLLLVADQGFGDMIQFARYIPMARKRVASLVIGWGPEVTALLGDHPDIAVCFPTWADAPPHDAYVLLSSLPEIFRTELESIPLPMPYLTPKPGDVAAWGRRLDTLLPPDRPRVGLAWSGRATHPNNLRRSIRLETLEPLLADTEVDFVTLQKPFPDTDRGFAAGLPHLLDISSELVSFRDTMAVMACLDLVIAVDTAVVHLAGAMGVEAWVLVSMPADWRWLLDRDDSAWYPTVRIFRQQSPADWAPVMDSVAKALRSRWSSGPCPSRLESTEIPPPTLLYPMAVV